MNERIRELAEQSGLLGPSSRVGDSHNATEKFAELIIEECVHIADIYVRAGEGVRPTVRSKIGIEIKLHFGIEDKAEEFENWCKESDDGGDDGKNT